jgi:glycosyltransferase involved in cell wall biosynthesis
MNGGVVDEEQTHRLAWDRSMRVLIATDVTGPGGVDTYVFGLAAAASASGCLVEVLLNQLPGSDGLARALASHNIPVHRGPLYHRVFSANEQRAATLKVLRERNPDIVHVACGIPWSCVVTRETVLAFGKPLLFTEQYVPSALAMDESTRQRLATIYSRAVKAICVCEENRLLLAREYGLPVRDVIVIPNAVRIPSRRVSAANIDVGSRRLRAAIVARLSHQKGIDCLLKAVSRLAADVAPRVHFSVIGDGPDRAELERLTNALGVSSAVTFHGWQENIAERLTEYDLFISPSRSEGQPFALLEAMVTELPVIATAVSGIPEALGNGRYGVLVPADDPEALAQAIDAFVRDPCRAVGMAARARHHVEAHHNLAVNAKRLVALWRESQREPAWR